MNTDNDIITDPSEIYKLAFRKWGSHGQAQVAVEECAELAAALSRFIIGKGSFEDVCEEMADVEIMIEQLKYHYGAFNDVANYRQEKLKRLEQRLLSATTTQQTELDL